MSEKHYCIVIKTDGTIALAEMNDEWFINCGDLLKSLVGGYFETTVLKRGVVPAMKGETVIIVVNEEGKLNGSHYNELASEIHGMSRDPLFGDAVICATRHVPESEYDEYDLGGWTRNSALAVKELIENYLEAHC